MRALHIAQQLQQVARGTDTVRRLGGDEFVLLLPECTLVDVQQIATRVLAAVRRAVLVARVTSQQDDTASQRRRVHVSRARHQFF